jgi:hypothetical protein
MQVKRILSNVTLVIADLEVNLGGELRSSPCLCALISGANGAKEQVIPLNTPDGRPVLMNLDNAIER